MNNLYVSETKRQVETVSYFGNFQDVLSPGEVIGTSAVVVTVVSGADGNPSNLLYEGIVNHGGTSIEQRIRLGIPGVIYDVTFTVITSLNNTFEKVTRLAILPNAQGAIPIVNIQYETSCLYPDIQVESFKTGITVANGRLALLRIDEEDGITTAIFIGTGSLIYQNFLNYSYNEGITTNISIQTGSLVYQNFTNYSYAEGITTGIAVLQSYLTAGTPITYSYNEGIKTSITIGNGTLV